MHETEPEPWLRGPIAKVPAHLLPIFFSFQQIREDLATHTAPVTPDQLWNVVVGKHSLGYQLKHMAGSVDRLSTYIVGQQLSQEQLAFLANEHTADLDKPQLLALCDTRFAAFETRILGIQFDSLLEPRTVGRQQLPTTVLGLLVHICEHTQRHLGQAILISRLLSGK